MGNPADRLPSRAGQRDLLPLGETQEPARHVASPPRTHPTVRHHPPSALLAIRPRRSGRIRDELTTLQRSPEHLHILADHVI